MSLPFSYARHSHYYSPWFRRGPALEDYQPPAPFPVVTVPYAQGDPYESYPYIRHYPMLENATVSPYARGKDRTVSGSMARHVHVTEGGASPWLWDHAGEDEEDDEMLDEDDDIDDITEVLSLRYGAAEAQKKARPFKAVSELFKPMPSGRTKADELVLASKRLRREVARASQQVRRAPLVRGPAIQERVGLTTGQAMAVAGGVAVTALLAGFLLGRR